MRIWSDKDIDHVRRRALQGWSYAMVAEELGASRNAIAGLAYRERIAFNCKRQLRVERFIASRWKASA